MNKEKIIDLLQEAITAKQYRQIEIINEFLKSIDQKIKKKNNKVCSNCLKKILISVYWSVLCDEPENLINLLPIFTILCGHLENTDSSCIMSII